MQLLQSFEDLCVVQNLGVSNDNACIHADWLAKLKPFVLPYGCDTWPFSWILRQHLTNKADHFLTDEIRDQVLAFQNFLVENGRIRVFKGKKAAHKCI